MDPKIKAYADSLYDQACAGARERAQERRREFMVQRVRQSPSLSLGPLGGNEISAVVKIYAEMIEHCMTARLESYEQAFNEAGRSPTDEELSAILSDSQAVRSKMVKQVTAKTGQFIASRSGGAPFVPDETLIEQSSAYGHDRVLQKWKTWRAKAQLNVREVKSVEREKQVDVLMRIYNRAEFSTDESELVARGAGAAPFSILFLDLDKFKSINDGAGHDVGDRALTALGATVLAVAKGQRLSVPLWWRRSVCPLA